MPNHCHNRVTFYSANTDAVAKLKQIFEDENCFGQIIPDPDWNNTPLMSSDVKGTVYDFSTTPEERAAEQANIDKAIEDAQAAMQVAQLEASLKKDAPAVTAIKSKKLVPAKKAAPKAKGKAGRIVGISADENKYIQQVLQMIADDSELGSSNPNYVKIQSRYNK